MNTNMNRVEKAVEFIPCPTCKARPKQRCKTRTGHPYAGTWYAHTPRIEPFAEEFRAGVKFASKKPRAARAKQSA